MQARRGDHLVIEQKKIGVDARRGEILEVLPGPGNAEHYRVRWDKDEHESIYFPAPGARVEPSPKRTRPRKTS